MMIGWRLHEDNINDPAAHFYSEEYDREKRTHPDLVPYDQLGQLEQDKDAVFCGSL